MKILVALDGSPAADIALELVAHIQWPAQSQLSLVVVVEPIASVLSAAMAPGMAYNLDEHDEQLVASAETILEEAAHRLAGTGAEIPGHVLRGRPGTVIVDAARELNADLIVLSSRGHGRVGSMLLGSVSAEVSDHASCPVLVARTPQLTRVILGVDGSEFALAAERLVAEWPIFERAAIEVTSVARTDAAWRQTSIGPYAPTPDPNPDVTGQVVAEHRKLADEATVRLTRAGRRATARVVEGDPAPELIRVAEETQADLIVLGSQGRTGLARLFLGSVARNVLLHAPCSVLIDRHSPEDSAPGS